MRCGANPANPRRRRRIARLNRSYLGGVEMPPRRYKKTTYARHSCAGTGGSRRAKRNSCPLRRALDAQSRQSRRAARRVRATRPSGGWWRGEARRSASRGCAGRGNLGRRSRECARRHPRRSAWEQKKEAGPVGPASNLVCPSPLLSAPLKKGGTKRCVLPAQLPSERPDSSRS